MELVGYADRLSVAPGETIRFMVSCSRETYQASVVRLIHGDENSTGPGFRERVVVSAVDDVYPGRVQLIFPGSYVIVPDHPVLEPPPGLTLGAWIWPTLPGKGAQGIVTKWSAAAGRGYGLVINADGYLSFWLGDGHGNTSRISAGAPLRANEWCFVAVSFDAEHGHVLLLQEPREVWPNDPVRLAAEHRVPASPNLWSAVPLVIGGYVEGDSVIDPVIGGHFNGKIDGLRIYARALSLEELRASRDRGSDMAFGKEVIAAWDFGADTASRQVFDRSANGLHGRAVNMPTRAVTGHNWSGQETDPRRVPEQYGAIWFHEDDVDDVGWEPDFAFTVSPDLPSGVYAARLQSEGAEDHIPFFVRPPTARPLATIAVLFPTLTYLAYGNEQGTEIAYSPKLHLPRMNPAVDASELRYLEANKLLSLYDFHADGSGVCYSSRLRPILNLRPKARARHIDAPHAFPADLYLVDWLEHEGFAFDAITDEDVHGEGAALLAPYQVVITGSHPEYWTDRMLAALRTYLESGGRVMYLGGNGFYWVTSIDPENSHLIEVRRWGGTGAWRAAPGEYYHSTTRELGGLWRNRGRSPQALVGVGFTGQGFDWAMPYRRQPDSFDPRVSFVFEGIDPDEPIGNCPNLVLGHGAAGHEIDRYDRDLGTPAHAMLLATATGFSNGYQAAAEEILMTDSMQGGTVNPRVRADMVYLEYPGGGAVFSVGSIAWTGSLSAHGYANTVATVTRNVLRRFSGPQERHGLQDVEGQGGQR
ncbi:MAG: LamG domain-containing protein [Chloroflexi bacterium]|nr:LamG domain-containing protein [Chloroflexota bacterium]